MRVELNALAQQPKLQEQVSDCWLLIDRQCSNDPKSERKGQEFTKREENRRIVRVFVSSTFIDFQNERDLLVKRVFPELRHWCQRYGLGLVDVDLRWGVPSETLTPSTVAICMDEIDRCMQDTDQQPFFLGMVGERYGWIPEPNRDLTPELFQQYKWIEGLSITHMEFLHGAYRDRNPNAMFMLRNDVDFDSLPEEVLNRFCDREPLSRAHLLTLREKLLERLGDHQVFDYFCRRQSMETDTATGAQFPIYAGLEDTFAPQILHFFKQAISNHYDLRQPDEELLLDDFQQKLFVEEITDGFVGRQDMLDMLQRIVDGEDIHTGRTIALTGKSGVGKTTLLAELVRRQSGTSCRTFFHFTGAGSDAKDCLSMLDRLRRFCVKTGLIDEQSLTDQTDDDRYSTNSLLWQLLRASNQRLVIVVDAVDQLDNCDTGHHLKWIPESELPPNVALIVGYYQSHMPTEARLKNRADIFHLCELPLHEQKLLVTNTFGRYGKRLDDRQLHSLLRQLRSPLWLTFALEELRMFGDFRQLNAVIDSLPDDTSDLIITVLRRLQRQDDASVRSADALCYLACSKFGLAETDLEQLLGSAHVWNLSKVFVKPFVSLPWSERRLVMCDRPLVKESILKALMTEDNPESVFHSRLADHYLKKDETMDRQLMVTLTNHLLRSNRHAEVAQMLMDHSKALFIQPFERREVYKRIKCQGAVFPNQPMLLMSTNSITVCQLCYIKLMRFPGMKTCFICQTISSALQPARLCSRHQTSNKQCFYCCQMLQPMPQLRHDMFVCVFCNFSPNSCCNLPLQKGRRFC